ncbi:MAG: hypothetical protein U0470_05835 [Anaerolineae bacterium]
MSTPTFTLSPSAMRAGRTSRGESRPAHGTLAAVIGRLMSIQPPSSTGGRVT